MVPCRKALQRISSHPSQPPTAARNSAGRVRWMACPAPSMVTSRASGIHSATSAGLCCGTGLVGATGEDQGPHGDRRQLGPPRRVRIRRLPENRDVHLPVEVELLLRPVRHLPLTLSVRRRGVDEDQPGQPLHVPLGEHRRHAPAHRVSAQQELVQTEPVREVQQVRAHLLERVRRRPHAPPLPTLIQRVDPPAFADGATCSQAEEVAPSPAATPSAGRSQRRT
jgi:hypothetical protein